jgi:hypothetical protein
VAMFVSAPARENKFRDEIKRKHLPNYNFITIRLDLEEKRAKFTLS